MSRVAAWPVWHSGAFGVTRELTRSERQFLVVVILLIAAVGTRSFDPVPGVTLVRPALTFGILGSLFALSRAGGGRIAEVAKQPVFVAVAALYGWAALTAPLALNAGQALAGLRASLPSLLLVLVILVAPVKARAIDFIERGFVLAAVMTSLGSLARGVYVENGRLSGYGTLDPNDLASITALASLIAIGIVMSPRRMPVSARIVWGGIGAFLITVMTMTGSRGGFLAISVGVATLIAIQPGGRRVTLMAIALVGAMLTWQFGPSTFRDRVGSLLAGEEDYNTTAYYGRKQIAERGVKYALANPIAGVGLQNFPIAEGRNCVEERLAVCRWKAPHNMYVQAAAELGLVGFGIFLVMLVTSIRVAWRCARGAAGRVLPAYARPELLACMMSYSIAGYFLSHAYLYAALALMALIQLTSFVSQRAVAEEAQPGGTPAPSPGDVAGSPRVRGRRGGLVLGRPGIAAYGALPRG